MSPIVKKCCLVFPLKLGVLLVAVFLVLNVILEVAILVTMSSLPPIIIGYGETVSYQSVFIVDLTFNLVVACCLFYAVPFLDSGFIGIPGVTLFVVNIISFVVFLFNGVSELALLFAVLALLSVAKIYFAVVMWSFADWIARTFSDEFQPDAGPITNMTLTKRKSSLSIDTGSN